MSTPYKMKFKIKQVRHSDRTLYILRACDCCFVNGEK